jgi:hypothetical protein
MGPEAAWREAQVTPPKRCHDHHNGGEPQKASEMILLAALPELSDETQGRIAESHVATAEKTMNQTNV